MKDAKTGERPRIDRLRRRPRLRRRDDLRARPAADVQDPSAGARRSSRAASGSRGARRRCPAGGYWSMPKLSMPGRWSWSATRAGWSTRCRAEGRPPRDQVGHARGRGDLRGAAARQRRSLRATSRRSRSRSVGRELWEVRNARQPLQQGLLRGGPLVRPDDRHQGRLPGRPRGARNDDAQPMFIGKTQGRLPQARRQLHLRQALVGVHHRQRDARRRAEPHPGAQTRPARDRRNVALDVPGRRVRDSRRTRPSTARSM